MRKLLAALIDAMRFSRIYRQRARITDDATRARKHDTRATLHAAWDDVERECKEAAARQRRTEQQALRDGSPSMHARLKAAPGETDFPG
jgi:F0F1-type ATP synthase membrane subunit b/b'